MHANHIIQDPSAAGSTSRCPYCRSWFALKYDRREPHPTNAHMDIYKCKKCGREVAIAGPHPPHVV